MVGNEDEGAFIYAQINGSQIHPIDGDDYIRQYVADAPTGTYVRTFRLNSTQLAQSVAPEAGRGAVEAFAEAQAELLDALGLEPLNHGLPPEELLAAMKHDKKVRSGELRFVLVDDIASWRVETLSDDLVLAALGG